MNRIVTGQQNLFVYYKTYDISLGCKPQPILSSSGYMVTSNIFKEAGGKIDDLNYNLSSSQRIENLEVWWMYLEMVTVGIMMSCHYCVRRMSLIETYQLQ